jgi:hypothetical protein
MPASGAADGDGFGRTDILLDARGVSPKQANLGVIYSKLV